MVDPLRTYVDDPARFLEALYAAKEDRAGKATREFQGVVERCGH